MGETVARSGSLRYGLVMTNRNSDNTGPDRAAPETASFGFRDVPADEKAGMVRGVFDSVASKYDVMNDLMSMGVHRLWKSDFVAALRPRSGEVIVDLAGGTGDIAERILDKTEDRARVMLTDINEAMVREGRDRFIDGARIGQTQFIVGDAQNLPYPDKSADAVTISFGIRNVTRIDQALQDIYRILKPGGRFYCLEFSRVHDSLNAAYDLYSFKYLPTVGKLITGDADSYQYLAESIRKFPDQEAFLGMIREAGFRNAGYRNLSAGIAAIHWGYRI